MKRFLGGAAVGVIVVVGVAIWSQALSVRWPRPALPDVAEVTVAVTAPEPPRVVRIEQVTLDCRARVHAEVPLVGRREHAVLGQVYRVDSITMTAVGDVDTCVEGASARIHHRGDGTTEIVVPGRSIVFVRPRVDAVATAASVRVDKGMVGKLTDVLPWVSDDLGLTPTAYAHAQNVIGGSACTAAAYAETEALLIDAYRQQFIDQGLDPDELVVRIEGRPTFVDPLPLDPGAGVDLEVEANGVSCVLGDSVTGDRRR